MNIVQAYAEIIGLRNEISMMIQGTKNCWTGTQKDSYQLATDITDKVFIMFMQNSKQGDDPIALTTLKKARKKKKDNGVDEFLDSMEVDDDE